MCVIAEIDLALNATIAMTVATIVMAAATIVNVFLTFKYVRLTHGIMRSQTDPCIIAYVRREEIQSERLVIVIENVGRGLARDVRLERSAGTDETTWNNFLTEEYEKTALSDTAVGLGIPALAPGDGREVPWGYRDHLEKRFQQGVAVVCWFRRPGESKNMRPMECVLEVKSLKHTYQPHEYLFGPRV